MIFKELEISGVVLISLEKHEDRRGFFARSFCKKEFAEHGLNTEFVQCNFSYNEQKGTLRGMHYQKPPYEEIKVVSCVEGAIYDVVLDIRKTSVTYGKWLNVELTAQNYNMLYIPKGLAHGFQTLVGHTMVYYQMSQFYEPHAEGGIKFDDKRFDIKWPILEKIMSEKDSAFGMELHIS